MRDLFGCSSFGHSGTRWDGGSFIIYDQEYSLKFSLWQWHFLLVTKFRTSWWHFEILHERSPHELAILLHCTLQVVVYGDSWMTGEPLVAHPDYDVIRITWVPLRQEGESSLDLSSEGWGTVQWRCCDLIECAEQQCAEQQVFCCRQ
jgi:hypothetical protein